MCLWWWMRGEGHRAMRQPPLSWGPMPLLVNTAIARWRRPGRMEGRAFALACTAGRSAYKATSAPAPCRREASSPPLIFWGAL